MMLKEKCEPSLMDEWKDAQGVIESLVLLGLVEGKLSSDFGIPLDGPGTLIPRCP